jgi:hypothetical protein
VSHGDVRGAKGRHLDVCDKGHLTVADDTVNGVSSLAKRLIQADAIQYLLQPMSFENDNQPDFVTARSREWLAEETVADSTGISFRLCNVNEVEGFKRGAMEFR